MQTTGDLLRAGAPRQLGYAVLAHEKLRDLRTRPRPSHYSRSGFQGLLSQYFLQFPAFAVNLTGLQPECQDTVASSVREDA